MALSKSEAGKLGYKASQKYHQEQFQHRKEEYAKNPSRCKCCGKPLPYNKRYNSFCNQSCSAIFNNTHRQLKKRLKREPKNIELKETIQKPKDTFKCLNCGKVQELKKGRLGKYCNNKCQYEHIYNQYIEKWKNGEVNGLSGEYNLSRHIKRYMLDKVGHKCELCGWHEVNPTTGKVPLEVHHIDGDYTNNKEENLQVLCPNCHSLTPTYKSINKKGRKGRRKYT